jgi:hypothetical protein
MPDRGTARQLAGNRVTGAVSRTVGVVVLLVGGVFVVWGTCLAAGWGIDPELQTGFRVFLGVLLGLLGVLFAASGSVLVRASR